MTTRPQHHILIVEDDEGVATLQRRRLERAGFTADIAADTDSAMARLASGGVDLVVMDYRLGQTSGLDLHRRMNATGFTVPVIMVSAALDDAAVIEAMRAGVRDVIVKTLDYLEYLPDAVSGVLKQTAAVPVISRSEKRGCVLIVEDDAGTAALEKRQLERAGYEVTVVTTAEAAIDEVRRGHVSLAVLDLRLPDGVTGIEVFERFKAEGRYVPAILVTGFPDQTVAIRALRAGIRDFVPKSADFLEYLPTAVDRVLGQARVERKLVESELRLASIIGTTMDAIVMCDPTLRIVLFNRSAEVLFGCSAEYALQRQLDAFIPEFAPDAVASHGPVGSIRERLEVEAVRADGQPGSTAPVLSVTVPLIRPRKSCALDGAAATSSTSDRPATIEISLMDPPKQQSQTLRPLGSGRPF
jgi:PAS domain S-box-containing protein